MTGGLSAEAGIFSSHCSESASSRGEPVAPLLSAATRVDILNLSACCFRFISRLDTSQEEARPVLLRCNVALGNGSSGFLIVECLHGDSFWEVLPGLACFPKWSTVSYRRPI